jgi:DNA-binding transcriptional ArsR family regulator
MIRWSEAAVCFSKGVMTMNEENPYEALEKVFHEPNRLAIMSALCVAADGMTFGDLKTECRLTDGNLNRHLKVLEEADVIRIRKAFVENKPRTTVSLSAKGLDRFEEYLSALGDVLDTARKAIREDKKIEMPAGVVRPARA